MDIILVQPDAAQARQGWASLGAQRWRCALGRSGTTEAKREGDGATPQGRLKLRRVFYRPDRLGAPRTALPTQALSPHDGWCDEPASPDYNLLVRLPHPARHERLWRDDEIYDLIVVLGWNDDPVVPGKGSAIFLHVARPDFTPTEGCVALQREALLALLKTIAADSWIEIRG